MGVKMKSKVSDRLPLAKLHAELRGLKTLGGYVRVGFIGEGGRLEGGLNNASIAAVHEYGYPEGGIPERPFMGPSFDANRTKYGRAIQDVLEGVQAGLYALDVGLRLLGEVMVVDVREYLLTASFAPNSPAVEARKLEKGGGQGPVKPLIDTGQMLRSLAYAVSREEIT